jgi:hypothetical protein
MSCGRRLFAFALRQPPSQRALLGLKETRPEPRPGRRLSDIGSQTSGICPPDVSRGEQQPESAPSQPQNVRARAGGPPKLEVGTSCAAAWLGAAILGRDKKACLGDETTAQDSLKQNWSKYSAPDKTDCVGMVTTGGPPSYVELLPCVEILRDARNIRNADALESDDRAIEVRRRKRK